MFNLQDSGGWNYLTQTAYRDISIWQWNTGGAPITSMQLRASTDSSSVSSTELALNDYLGTTTKVNLNTNGNSWFNGGNVGIGTSLPQASLDVNGPVMNECVYIASLPTGHTGMRHCVADATACTFMSPVAGGGSTVCPVFYNGSTWVGG